VTTKKTFNWVVNDHQIVSIEDIFWLFPPTEVWLFAHEVSNDKNLQNKHRARWAARGDKGVEYIEVVYEDGADEVYAWCGIPGIFRKDELHRRSLDELLTVVVQWHQRNRDLIVDFSFMSCSFIDEGKDESIL
jgi:hypothetical protein